MRPKLNEFRIEQIGEALTNNEPVDPLNVVYDGSQYWLWNGFHRREGYEKAKRKAAPCIVTPGTQRDAVKLALGANADQNEEPRDRETIANAIKTALLDDQWGDQDAFSNREIARWVKVNEATIRRWREKLQAEREELREEEDTEEATLPVRPTRVRTGNGKRMDTSNIGSAQKKAAAQKAAAVPASAATASAASTVATERPALPALIPQPPVLPKPDILIQEGDAWNLDDHRIYCGESTDYEFQKVLLPSALALVTLPPGSFSTDEGFLSNPDFDWLAQKARTIAVLIQEASAVPPFLAQCHLHYEYAMGCTLYREWGILVLFSSGKGWNYDELDDAYETSPNKLLAGLLDTYTQKGDAVIVVDGPQQGAFSPLVVCQEWERRCLLASTYKSTLQQQISHYKSTFVPV